MQPFHEPDGNSTVARHAARVLRVALRIVGMLEDAEDGFAEAPRPPSSMSACCCEELFALGIANPGRCSTRNLPTAIGAYRVCSGMGAPSAGGISAVSELSYTPRLAGATISSRNAR
jgi:hypothetical protein